jgi:hypothetical protein
MRITRQLGSAFLRSFFSLLSRLEYGQVVSKMVKVGREKQQKRHHYYSLGSLVVALQSLEKVCLAHPTFNIVRVTFYLRDVRVNGCSLFKNS